MYFFSSLMVMVCGRKSVGWFGEIRKNDREIMGFHSRQRSFPGAEEWGHRGPDLMRRYTLSLLACLLAALSGCSKSETPAPPKAQTESPTPSPAVSSVKTPLDACSLLTSDEIKAIQGEAVESTKPTPASEGEVASSQCFFQLPTFV